MPENVYTIIVYLSLLLVQTFAELFIDGKCCIEFATKAN